jgi:asparagine synthase (glutamine-hydrolysing)
VCGIAGMLTRPSEETIRRMLDQQRHRGPDGRKVWSVPGGAGLGHDRLAIIDVAGGAQPIANEDETLFITINGEIYNHRTLRAELEERHVFRTESDSEVVLHLFEEEGPACVRRLDGMFAIAIWGPRAGLFLARDPLGIKPLYWGRDNRGSLLWASEIKALIGEVGVLHELLPGSWWQPQVNHEPTTYWAVPEPSFDLDDPGTAVDSLEQSLRQAIHKRLMADVPLGLFLSGGLDSSLIAAMVRQEVAGDLHSFAVGLEGSADLLSARLVAERIGTIHHERVLRPDAVIEAVPAVVALLESYDPALVRSAIPTFSVAEVAAEYVKVVLSGEGADELFAGYQYLTEFEGDEAALAAELRLITAGLHNVNLQRVDRMTMAHGLEGRVPFLDMALVDLAFRMNSSLKRRGGHAKWVLRKVAERYLPPEIVWRPKEKFAMGTGIGPLLQRHAEETQNPAEIPAGWLPEAWWYWKEFRSRYGREDVLACMGRSRSLNPGQRPAAVSSPF